METYLFKFSACLLVFWLIYVFLLERQKNHIFKRFYLLGTLAIAVIIPLLTITQYIESVAVTNIENALSFIPMKTSNIETGNETKILLNIEHILWIVYGIGVLLFAARFIVNLNRMYKRIKENTTFPMRSFVYVLLEAYRIPHSFFKYIFLDKTSYETNTIPEEVILHEETHAKQLHSIDIIVLELLQIVFWFHPLIYILKHHIKLNHEFLADQAVINNGIETAKYQNILLQFSSSTQNHQLVSAINYSSFKKRFTVMKTQTSKTRIWLSTILLLPIIAVLFYSFAEREYIEKNTPEIKKAIEDKLKKASENKLANIDSNDQIKEYLITYEVYKKLQDTPPHYIKKSKEEQLQMEVLFSDLGGLYFRLSKANKSKVERAIAPILPYARITLNGKTYYKKKVNLTEEEKATLPPPPPPPPAMKKSKGGPNSNDQVDSFSIPQQKVTKKEISAYNAWAKKIHGESKALSDDATFFPPIDKEDLIKFSEIYKRMSAQQKKQAIEYPFPGIDVKENNQNISISPITRQQIATKKQIAEYNAWAKRINNKMAKANANNDVNDYPIIKVKEVKKYKAIYDRMTEAQKKVAEPWPSFPPPPEPPAPPKAPKAPKAPKPTVKELKKVPAPPPPPEPEEPIAFIKRMANTNAQFFSEGKPISNNDAIKLVRNNPNLNIHSKKTDTQVPLIYISKRPIIKEVKEKSKN